MSRRPLVKLSDQRSEHSSAFFLKGDKMGLPRPVPKGLSSPGMGRASNAHVKIAIAFVLSVERFGHNLVSALTLIWNLHCRA
jgi:hypothetical protein